VNSAKAIYMIPMTTEISTMAIEVITIYTEVIA
jgi:hypothetical protein